jgi:hypothetical protein
MFRQLSEALFRYAEVMFRKLPVSSGFVYRYRFIPITDTVLPVVARIVAGLPHL